MEGRGREEYVVKLARIRVWFVLVEIPRDCCDVEMEVGGCHGWEKPVGEKGYGGEGSRYC